MKPAAEHLRAAELCAGETGYSSSIRRAVALAAIEASVAEERARWREWLDQNQEVQELVLEDDSDPAPDRREAEGSKAG